MANYTNIGYIEILSGGAGNPRVFAGVVDPSAGAGVPAQEGSLFQRFGAGAGQLWLKTGAADTAWTQLTAVSPSNTVDVEDEGVPVGAFGTLNFTGAGVTATDAGGGVTDVAVPGAGVSTIDVEEEGVAVGTFNTLNFTGAGVTATDLGGGVAGIAVPGGGGGGGGSNPDYLVATMSADQLNLVANDAILFDTVPRSAGTSIALNTLTGVFTLQPGRYLITGNVGLVHTGGFSLNTFAWNNDTIGIPSAIAGTLVMPISANSTNARNPTMVPHTVIDVAVATDIAIRAITVFTANVDVEAAHTTATILRLPSVAATQFISAGLSADQVNPVANDAVIWDTIHDSVGTDISLNVATGVFTLAAGTYMVWFQLSLIHSSGISGVEYAWNNDTVGIPSVIPGTLQEYLSQTSTQHRTEAPVGMTFLVVAAPTDVAVRLITAGVAGVDINDLGSSVKIMKLP